MLATAAFERAQMRERGLAHGRVRDARDLTLLERMRGHCQPAARNYHERSAAYNHKSEAVTELWNNPIAWCRSKHAAVVVVTWPPLVGLFKLGSGAYEAAPRPLIDTVDIQCHAVDR
jgi:hypothetical protein